MCLKFQRAEDITIKIKIKYIKMLATSLGVGWSLRVLQFLSLPRYYCKPNNRNIIPALKG